MMAKVQGGQDTPEGRKRVLGTVPLGRACMPGKSVCACRDSFAVPVQHGHSIAKLGANLGASQRMLPTWYASLHPTRPHI